MSTGDGVSGPLLSTVDGVKWSLLWYNDSVTKITKGEINEKYKI